MTTDRWAEKAEVVRQSLTYGLEQVHDPNGAIAAALREAWNEALEAVALTMVNGQLYRHDVQTITQRIRALKETAP